MRTLPLALAVAALGTAALTPATLHAQALLYGLTTANSLVVFSDTGATVAPGAALTGMGAGESAVALDFRPFTGDLYVLSRDAASLGRLYTANPATGALSPVALSGPPLTLNGSVDIDFNPVAGAGVNALRVLTGAGENYRLAFTAAGATVNVDGAVNIPGGATGTNIIATAYTRNVAGLPGGGGVGGTAQYAVDSSSDTLYRVNPPNDGTLTEPKPLGLDVEARGGLDIVTGTDRALGLFSVAGVNALYEVSLASGAATLLRELPGEVVNFTAALPVVFPPTLVYGLTHTNSLVSFRTDGTDVADGPVITGLGAGETVVGLDFRPLTGALYALSRDAAGTGRLYTVDPATGAAAAVALAGPAIQLSESADIDFNPAAVNGVNALRILTSAGLNYRLVFTEAGATVNVDGAVNVTGGATGTNVIATAYTRNVSGLPGGGGAGGTAQYALDSSTATLYRVNPPNNGTLTEPKPLPFAFGGTGGLDVVTGSDRALAVLEIGGGRGLFELNLATGAAGLVRTLPANVVDLAVPMPVTLTGLTSAEGGTMLAWSGGVGPYAVKRADVVSDPACSFAAVTGRSLSVTTDGSSGFFRVADLAAVPAVRLTVSLSGAAERPNPVTTLADGFGTLEVNGNTLSFNLGYQGLSGPAVAAHIHGAADSTDTGGVLIDLGPFNGGAFGTAGTFIGSVSLTLEQKAALLGGKTYVNIHTAAHGNGELRGQVTPAVFHTLLSGAAERPEPVSTDATGFGSFTVIGRELAFHVTYRGLSGPAAAAHIHGPADASGSSGVLIDLAPFNGGDFGTSGSLAGRVTLTPAQLGALVDGKTYVNIHTAAHGGGEIRGQIRPVITGTPFAAELTGAAERPDPVATMAGGFSSFTLEGDTLGFLISYRGLSGPAVAAHLHGPAAASGTAGVLFDLAPFHVGAFGTEGYFRGSLTLATQQRAALLNGDCYINIHTGAHPNGELRGQVKPTVLRVTLNEGNERPDPVTTEAAGYGYLGLVGRELSVGVRYAGLSGPATAAHLHGPAPADSTAGVLLDLGPLAAGGFGAAGFFQGGFTLDNTNVSAVTDGLTYVNIHTVLHGGGEIRGQVVP